MRRTVFFVMFLMLSSQINAVSASDSLLIELKNTPQNKEKSLLYNDLSKQFQYKYLDSAFYFANKGLRLAREIEFKEGVAENAASLADYYVMADSLNKAKEYYQLAINYFKDLNKPFDVAQIYMVLGNIYLSQNNYSEALLNYQISQRISEENSLEEILPHIYNNSGIIYKDLEERDKALNNFTKAYNGFKRLGLKEEIANAVSNIAMIHLENGNDSLAMEYYQEALKMFQETGNSIGASNIYIDLGNLEYDQGNYQDALESFENSYRLIIQQDAEYRGPKSRAMVASLGNLGRVHAKMGNTQKAKNYLEQSLQLALQNHYIHWVEVTTYELSKIYENSGDYDTALNYFKTYEQYGDSILNESSIKQITQLEMQYKFDQKMKEIELENIKKEARQQRKELIYIIFIILGVFIAILAILMYFAQRSKTARLELKRQNLKLEHDKLHQELEHKNRELATNVMYLLQKNEFITSTAEKLTKAKMSFKKENQKIIQDVIRDLLLNSSKDVWKEFEVRFQEVHSEFYDNLHNKFPDLTPNEKKICAFLRLNMSTKDISAITFQSVRSINMARFRLRKKMGLDSDENLVAYLAQF